MQNQTNFYFLVYQSVLGLVVLQLMLVEHNLFGLNQHHVNVVQDEYVYHHLISDQKMYESEIMVVEC
jgi:hypothetical protein